MVNVSDELKEAFLSHTEKHILLSFSDNTTLDEWDFQLESMEIEQAICDENLLTFGKCASSCFKGTINNDSKSRIGLEFDVTISTTGLGDTEYTFNLGHYKVYEDNVSDDRNTREIVAYDSLYEVLKTDYKDWYFNLHLDTTPMTLKQFRDSFFTHVGITQETKTLINDNFTVVKTINAKSLTGQDILQAICELNACFGNIGYDGKFRYVTFMQEFGIYPRDDLYPANDLYPDDPNVAMSITSTEYLMGTFVYQDYVCQKIDSVSIREDSDDDGVYVGSGTNTYSIEGNFLTFGTNNTQRTALATNFLDFVKEFFYVPTKIQMWGMPWIEVGDLIQAIGKTTAIVFPVLHRTLKGITALKDTFEAKGSPTYEKAQNSMLNQFEKYKSQTMKVVRNLDGFYQQYTTFVGDVNSEFESQSSRITQNANSISAEVTRASNAEGNLSSRIDINAEAITSKVEKNGVISAINQTAETIKISANKINLTGYVTVTELSTAGATEINGANIKTGSVIASVKIEGSTLETTNGIKITNSAIEFTQDVNALRFQMNSSTYTTIAQTAFDSTYSWVTKLCDGVITHIAIPSPSDSRRMIFASADSNFYFRFSNLVIFDQIVRAANIEVINALTASGNITGGSVYSKGAIQVHKDSSQYGSIDYDASAGNFNFQNESSGWSNLAAANFIQASSRLVKENIKDISDNDALKLLQIRPVSFDYKKSKTHSHGMIAEEVYDIYPDLVVIPKNWDESKYTDETINVPSIDYSKFVPYMIKLLQIQQKEIEELRKNG